MEKSGIRVKKILQMNAGIRSRHTNAYFTGIGKTKQIVLFDTLIESHTHNEILGVLTHKAGHFRKKHVPRQLVIFASLSLAAFYATWLFIQCRHLFSTFGFSAPALRWAFHWQSRPRPDSSSSRSIWRYRGVLKGKPTCSQLTCFWRRRRAWPAR